MRDGESSPARGGAHPVLWAMAAVMLGFELMFAAAQAGLVPDELSRWPVYQRLAFFTLHLQENGSGFYREVFVGPTPPLYGGARGGRPRGRGIRATPRPPFAPPRGVCAAGPRGRSPTRQSRAGGREPPDRPPSKEPQYASRYMSRSHGWTWEM